MMEAKGPAYLIVAEHEATLDDQLYRGMDAGATILQQSAEATGALLHRARRGARALGESGYQLAGARLVLGPHDDARLADRLELARGLVELLGPDAMLHLIASNESHDQLRLLELVGWLLADGRGTPRIHLTFRSQEATSRPPLSGPRSSVGMTNSGALDLTG